MELRNKWAIYIFIGLAGVCLILAVIKIPFKDVFKKGKRVAALEYIMEEPYFKFKVIFYNVMLLLVRLCALAAMLFAVVLVARPFVTRVEEEENYARDIILCMDVSYSVDELNMALVDNLQDTVSQLKGERFGIVIFNSSPVMLCPLTDDYEYVNDLLEQIRNAISCRSGYDYEGDDYWYLYNYITEGTLVGNEARGSSLTPDGLAAAAYDFPAEEDELTEENERTRIIIFSTDNDVYGDPLVTLDQAGKICKEENVIVYGIGTNFMYEDDIQEMKAVVEYTGGEFYLQEDEKSVNEIVKEIEKQGKNLVKGEKIIYTEDTPEKIIMALIFAVAGIFVFSKTIRL